MFSDDNLVLLPSQSSFGSSDSWIGLQFWASDAIEVHNLEPVTPVEVHNLEPVTPIEVRNVEPVTPIEDRIARAFEL